jgi:hypothetical protein
MSTRSEIDKFGFNLICNLELEGGGSTITYLHSFIWFHDANFIRGGSSPYRAALPDPRPPIARPSRAGHSCLARQISSPLSAPRLVPLYSRLGDRAPGKPNISKLYTPCLMLL